MTTDLTKCPGCGGEADNGHDRCYPPNVYYCTRCEDRATIAAVLKERLEGEKRELRPSEWVLEQEIPDFHYIGYNQAIDQAIAIIDEVLTSEADK